MPNGKTTPAKAVRERARKLRQAATALESTSGAEPTIEHWEKVLEFDSGDVTAHMALGRLYSRLERPELALPHLAAVPATAAAFSRARKRGERLAKVVLKSVLSNGIAAEDIKIEKLSTAIEALLGNHPDLMKLKAALARPTTPDEPDEVAAEPQPRAFDHSASHSFRAAEPGALSGLEAVELVAQLDQSDFCPAELDDIKSRFIRHLPKQPWLLGAMLHYHERHDRLPDYFDFLRGIDERYALADAWLDAARAASRLAATGATLEFCDRALLRSKYSLAVTNTVVEILCSTGLEIEAASVWKRAMEKNDSPKIQQGFIRFLARRRKYEELVCEGLRLLDIFQADEHHGSSDWACITEIARRTARALRACPEALAGNTLPRVVGENCRGEWADWLRGIFAGALGDGVSALAAFERARNAGENLIPCVDFNAEIGLLHAELRRYGNAINAFGEACPTSLENRYYARRYAHVKAVMEFCQNSHEKDYPECLIETLLQEASLMPARYEPLPRSLLTVCHALCLGGSEKQAVAIFSRLAAHSRISKLAFAVRSVDGEGKSFLLPQLRTIPLEPIVYGENWFEKSPLDEEFRRAFPSARFHGALDLLQHSRREEVVRLCKVILDNRPAAVHIRQDMDNCALACALAGVPRIVLHRGSLSPEHWRQEPLHAETRFRPMRYTYRTLIEQARMLIVNNSRAGSESDRSWLEDTDPGCFRVISNAMEFEAWDAALEAGEPIRSSHGIADDSFVIGGVFRLHPVKRPMFWMSVAEKIANRCPTAHFLIVGDGELGQSMRDFASARGFAERVHMPGQVRNVGPWYCAMDLNLLTSEREGLPNVLIEGQHFGVPALAPDVGGVRETIAPGITGQLLPPQADADAFADAALAIWQDRAWRAAARKKAPAFVHTSFGHAQAVNALLECFGFDG